MYQLSVVKWILGGATAFLVGFSKAGVPALGTLLAPLFAHVLPARAQASVRVRPGSIVPVVQAK